MISNFVFNFTNFCVIAFFFTKLLKSGILFPTAGNAKLVPKPVIQSTVFSVSVILAFISVF